MSEHQAASSTGSEVRFTGGVPPAAREPRNWKPLLIAAAAVLIVLGAILLLNRHAAEESNPGGANLAPAAAYAASLPLTQIHMSTANTMAGGSQTYLDGVITNRGKQTVTGVTVQVAFRDFSNVLAQKATVPLTLIRSTEPYVDIEPVSAAPLAPGQSQPFRLIFDSVTSSWNTQYPEVRVIAVQTR
jgi:hypothetical protein